MKTLTALVMTGALALGACRGNSADRSGPDVRTVIKEDGKTNAAIVTKYFDINHDGVVDARLRGEPFRSSTGGSVDYMAVGIAAGQKFELLVNPSTFAPNDGLRYMTPQGTFTLPIARTGTMTPAQRDAISAEYAALK